ncbi:hypothetical protein RAB80_008321 [Fusarium oxysporum f. sp. vasinfectum]|nr:hypothetical protein RAB80_008321 [Fusarium oxysporum f. sp. vasinfectum]KAK2932797.1 hypothetical protein FoTM2_007256 [Fusarium oxysporum f. sp. vasinfectum]
MLEYLTYKKIKKNRAEKAAAAEETAKKTEAGSSVDPSYGHVPDFSNDASRASGHQHRRRSTQHSLSSNTPPLSPVLDRDDEAWLQSILEDDGPAPPLPPRINTPQIDLSSASESEIEADGLKPEDNVAPPEAEREEQDLGNVLDRLNLQAKNNKIVSLSNESSELLSRFTQVFKDLANGVPTAYGDLASLVEDRDGAINRGFEKLPSSLKKLVTQLPDKLTSSLAPELLAAAAESQGLKANTEKGVKDAAIDLLKPSNLTDLVTKPGAVVGMLKAIVNALKVRWPAFIGTNVIWSVALFLLMFVLWYCHKRGREVRLEREKSLAETPVDGSDRIEELPDDPLLPGPEAAAASRNADRAILGDPVSPLSEPSPIPAVVEPVSPEEPVRRR